MSELLRETWISVQKAETSLVQAGARLCAKDSPGLCDGLELNPALRPILIRFASGFNPALIRADDYLRRYPFSKLNAIDAQLKALSEAGMLVLVEFQTYALTEQGVHSVRTYIERVGQLIDNLTLDLSDADAQKLLAYDQAIVGSLRNRAAEQPSSIFEHRLRGLHHDYSSNRLWHHWHYVWTMIAAREDAEEQIGIEQGIDPLAWLARHELWFTSRRPLRARTKSCPDLAEVAQRYAPLQDADDESQAALNRLLDLGWINSIGEDGGLTEQGLKAADRDEAMVDAIFFSRWPQFSNEELAEMKRIADAINHRCDELVEQHKAQQAAK
ncbi:hypothetical protein KKG90_03635 [Candidatus Bipolaricaulota bacterium]|nr:hypothetical protein [Candidatus Bipolaricaulota bacterium]